MGKVLGYAGICIWGVARAVWFAIHAEPGRRYRRAAEGRCRGCGYDLGGASAGLSVELDGQAWGLGPAHCPECGQSWPRVFPQ
jgi:hypothetical protein